MVLCWNLFSACFKKVPSKGKSCKLRICHHAIRKNYNCVFKSWKLMFYWWLKLTWQKYIVWWQYLFQCSAVYALIYTISTTSHDFLSTTINNTKLRRCVNDCQLHWAHLQDNVMIVKLWLDCWDKIALRASCLMCSFSKICFLLHNRRI